jgi:DNA-binding IclR family transcriptional regulator
LKRADSIQVLCSAQVVDDSEIGRPEGLGLRTAEEVIDVFALAVPIAAGGFAIATLLCAALPTRAVTDEEVIDIG